MADLTIKTNNVPRDIIDACELTPKEREQFDYLDWEAIDDGRDSASFVRYKKWLYNLSDFMRVSPGGEFHSAGWHGAAADGYFSGILITLVDDGERAVMGHYYS